MKPIVTRTSTSCRCKMRDWEMKIASKASCGLEAKRVKLLQWNLAPCLLYVEYVRFLGSGVRSFQYRFVTIYSFKFLASLYRFRHAKIEVGLRNLKAVMPCRVDCLRVAKGS